MLPAFFEIDPNPLSLVPLNRLIKKVSSLSPEWCPKSKILPFSIISLLKTSNLSLLNSVSVASLLLGFIFSICKSIQNFSQMEMAAFSIFFEFTCPWSIYNALTEP